MHLTVVITGVSVAWKLVGFGGSGTVDSPGAGARVAARILDCSARLLGPVHAPVGRPRHCAPRHYESLAPQVGPHVKAPDSDAGSPRPRSSSW